MKNILDLVPYMNHDDFNAYSDYKVPDNPTPFS